MADIVQVTVDDYSQLVEVENPNREEDTVEARSVEAALSALAVGESTPEDRHPERCGKHFIVPTTM